MRRSLVSVAITGAVAVGILAGCLSPVAAATPSPATSPGSAEPSPPSLPAVDPVPGGLPWRAVAGPMRPAWTSLGYLTPWRGGFAALQSQRRRGDRAMRVWHSADGASWDVSPLPGGITDVIGLMAFDGGLALIAGAETSGSGSAPGVGWSFDVWRSRDAVRWDRVGGLEARLPRDLRDWHVRERHVTVAAGRLVAIASVRREPCCGIRPVPVGPGIAVLGMAAQATGDNRTFTWTSRTGADWQRHRARGLADASGWEILRAVRRAPDGLIGLRDGAERSLVRSVDGVRWETVAPLPDRFELDGVYSFTVTSRGYLLAGSLFDLEEPQVWLGTPDGRWTSTLQLPHRTYTWYIGTSGDIVVASGYRQLAWGEEGYIRHPVILVSLDGGVTWDGSLGWTAAADAWPVSENDCLGPLAVARSVAVLIGCPTGTAAVFAATLPAPAATDTPMPWKPADIVGG